MHPLQPTNVAASRGSTVPVESTGGRVLIVDDEPLLARMLKRILSSEHDVVAVLNGREALERVAFDPPFDVMVCDMMMPDMTGLDVYAQLIQSVPDLAARTIFITGGVFSAREREFLESIPQRWIAKPFGLQHLRMAVRTLINCPRPRVESSSTASDRGESATCRLIRDPHEKNQDETARSTCCPLQKLELRQSAGEKSEESKGPSPAMSGARRVHLGG